ncbi:MAG TPA: filamentous hemagglutinin N-terminal domain-containing protein, partial [Xanthobacteraceae bacterium]|nr:filamentous hemagglutinin N-terminal domain-containing protein [Xanthobacteraceae bacterium]
MIRSHTLNRKLALLASALMVAPSGAYANPLGGQVVGGQAGIAGQGTKTVTVTQGSSNAIINWNSFNIGAGELTQFIQPSATSIALNRVIGNGGPSQIFGSLQANGRIFVVNPYGMLFGPGATVNVAGFLATTHDIKNEDFMAGRYNFNIPGRPDASIVNLGTIHVTPSSGGFAALVAPGVRNAGVITANLGEVALASGNGFTLDFYGDKLITLQVGDQIASQVIDVATGQPLKSLVSNEGTIKANGGQVALTAVAARTVVDSVINNTGTIEANSVGTKNGMIVLGAATAADKGDGAPTQIVNVSGTLSAAGKRAGTTGGTVQITGEQIALNSAKVDVSGQAGGGSVKIGGKGLNPSTTVTIDNASLIDASAKATGNGGNVVVWSNGATSVAGSILATGGAQGGNGGSVETSGQTVDFSGISVDTSAPNGTTGMWLIDPTNIVIDGFGATILSGLLGFTNITLQTTEHDWGWQAGDIIVNSSLSWSSGHTLTLDAYHSIDISAPITAQNGG